MRRSLSQLISLSRNGSPNNGVKLAPEEESHLQNLSSRILADKTCEVSPLESSLYIYPPKTLYQPSKYFPSAVDTLKWVLYRRNISTGRLTEITKERLQNVDLQDMFGLNPNNFNHRVYWLTLHSWMLHQRFLVDKLQKLESDYVDHIWLLPYKWMLDKGVPRHRLQVELEHAHRYSLKFSVELDQAIRRPEILPGQIAEVIWRTVFAEDSNIKSASDPRVILLTKYVIRTLNFVLNSVPSEHFVQGAFIWPSFRTKEKNTSH
jgi:hypothetical protein